MNLGGGHEGLGRQRHHDLRIGPPLCQQREAAIGLAAGSGDDPLGHLFLEHQRQRLPEGRPFGRGQPADQQFGADVIGQVRGDADRRCQKRQRVDLQRVAVQHRQPPRIGPGDLGQSGQGTSILFDGQDMTRALGQQSARQAAGAGADFQHIALADVPRLTGDLRGQIQIQKEVLAQLLPGPQIVARDHLPQGRQIVDAAHAGAAGGFAPPDPRRVLGQRRSLIRGRPPCRGPSSGPRWSRPDRRGRCRRCRRRCRDRARCGRRAGPV